LTRGILSKEGSFLAGFVVIFRFFLIFFASTDIFENFEVTFAGDGRYTLIDINHGRK
jgi:hypothetical protein